MKTTTRDLKSRVEKYIYNMERVLRDIKRLRGGLKVEEVISLSKRYLEDSKYYLECGDLETSALCIAYAEGLVDALRILGLADFKWPSKSPREKPKVLVGGTFDILHPGHVYLLEEAAKIGRVHVIVARDSNSIKYKGKKPIVGEEQRLYMVKSLKQVYEAVLGEEDPIDGILKVKPDVILLGPDQKMEEEYIRRELEKRGYKKVEILRLKSRSSNFELSSSTSIVEEVLKRYCR